MYPKYFGLKEPSFSIAPDPHYLFLSEQHKEALAHLLYGAGESGGFVLLTGEVGTGKTTVCRAFLEQLPDGVDVALILNPAQTAHELLLSICDEFRIPMPGGKRSIKLLVDRLNTYLLESHGRGHRPVLIIDEAQNLRPMVLEQIRLLTNLETTKHKLLQIFLIGQPELRRMLESDWLRQLNQRITARFHLTPFNLKDTGNYIRHRVAVAGVDRPLFTARAIRLIYQYSGGIPRLINILCDRALLGTCVTRGSQVTPSIVLKAAREVRGDPIDVMPQPHARPLFIAAAAFAVALGLGWWRASWINGAPNGLPAAMLSKQEMAKPVEPLSDQGADQTAETGATEASEASAFTGANSGTSQASTQQDAVAETASGADRAQASSEDPPGTDLASAESDLAEAALERLAMPESDALSLLLRRWDLELDDLGQSDPCTRLPRFGLSCAREQGKLSNVRFFDLPALLEVATPEAGRRFIVLSGLGDTEATLDLSTGSERVPIAWLERVWTGDYLLVWQLPPGGSPLINMSSTGEDVRWLRRLLSEVPGLGVSPSDSPRLDYSLADALRVFQESKGLVPDGIAGPRTLIQLSHAVEMPGIPRLSKGSLIPETVVDAP